MHLLITGMPGSGKSEGGLTDLTEILSCRDVEVWASDPVKAEQPLGHLLPAIGRAALDMKSTEAVIAAIKEAIPARTAWLAKYGYKQWVPECASPRPTAHRACPT
ncbi:hypothetical protein ACFY1P_15560 [Streptomyces sp. NPDC001407]|uniref:hypothetical protein n=1 Tax=Streptomyces sp. NPDC001407 TaxID=3364573 RepID=UPI0036C0C5BD